MTSLIKYLFTFHILCKPARLQHIFSFILMESKPMLLASKTQIANLFDFYHSDVLVIKKTLSGNSLRMNCAC